MEFSNGIKYLGEYKEGLKHGHGKITYSDLEYYEGDWKDGRYEGIGKELIADGTIYEG